MKKRFFLLCGGCMLALGITIAGVAAKADGSQEESSNQENIELKADNWGTNSDKDILYSDYIAKTIVSGIEDYDGVLDCEIDINCTNGEILSVNVDIVAKSDRADTLETDVLDYVSESLGISAEKVTLSFHE